MGCGNGRDRRSHLSAAVHRMARRWLRTSSQPHSAECGPAVSARMPVACRSASSSCRRLARAPPGAVRTLSERCRVKPWIQECRSWAARASVSVSRSTLWCSRFVVVDPPPAPRPRVRPRWTGAGVWMPLSVLTVVPGHNCAALLHEARQGLRRVTWMMIPYRPLRSRRTTLWLLSQKRPGETAWLHAQAAGFTRKAWPPRSDSNAATVSAVGEPTVPTPVPTGVAALLG